MEKTKLNIEVCPTSDFIVPNGWARDRNQGFTPNQAVRKSDVEGFVVVRREHYNAIIVDLGGDKTAKWTYGIDAEEKLVQDYQSLCNIGAMGR